MGRCFALRCLLVLGVASAPLPVAAERWLWTSPDGDTELLDQAQTTIGPYAGMQNGHGVGQSFVPTAGLLERLDLMLFNRHDRRPFTIRLWEWVDGDGDGLAEDSEYAATVVRPPLWTDRLALAGPPERQRFALYPHVAVRPGVPHYFELSNDTGDGEWTAYTAQSASVDPYGLGGARLNGRFQSVPATALFVDLWFETHGPPVGTPAPSTCEDTGEPAPCASAAATWVEPAPAGAPLGAEDYLQIVQRYADYGRASVLAGNGSNAHEYAFFDAFLYRATGDESHAAQALALLDRALTWREANPTAKYSLFWTEYAGWAYRWIAGSSTLSPASHARIRRLLVLQGLGLAPVLEAGMDNHALGCTLSLKLITDLVPAGDFPALSGGAASASTHAAWKSFADAQWSEYKTRFEIWEDASQYHYFQLRHILELSELYGDESALWSSPAFRAFVDRGFAAHTPLGPHALHGDTLGWNESWGTAAWVFETAARRLGDPRYRWLAQRVFDYQRTHLRATRIDGTPVEPWQAVYNEYPAFAHAYFAHDPTTPVAAPTSLAPLVAARQDATSDTPWPCGTTPLAQTFVAEATPLVRIEVQARDGGAPVVGEVRLWSWLGSRSATVAATPIHAERFPFATGGAWRTIAFEPFVDVTVGQTYFLEIRADGACDLAGSAMKAIDRYPVGELWAGIHSKTGADLWFRTWTLGGSGSTITDRLEAVWRRPTQWGAPLRPMDFTGARVPDKLVLRSGWEPESLHLVANLIGGDYYHGQEETGAVLSLTSHGARLLADGTYFDRLDQHHAVPIVRRHTGARREVVAPVSVVHFRDADRAVVAQVSWGDRDGWPVDHERRFLMVKDRFVLVRDRTRFAGPLEASTGPLWTSNDLRPERGPNWFELYDREPRAVSGLRFANPEQYLLLWLVPRQGVTIEAWRELRTGNPPSPAYLAAQRWTGDAAAGDERWFDSLLVPHGPEIAPAQAAAAVSVLYDDGTAVALRLELDGETWTVVDNPAGASIASALLDTDAAYAITRTRIGDPEYVFVRDATRLRVDDGRGRTIDRTWLARSSAEIGTAWRSGRGGRGTPAVDPTPRPPTP